MNNFTINHHQYSDEDIAVIGMAGRFPEADNLDQFWSNLATGRHSVREFPEQRKQELGNILGEIPQINFLRQGYLEHISMFEPELFGMNAEESKYMDPQQRILLELVEEAIADAGYAPDRLAESEVGIFVSENENMYTRNFHGLSFMTFVNGLQSASSGRIAYTYNFRGPAYMIGSACSSTLVALHAACESLRRNDCDCAVAGGVRLDLFPIDQSQIASVPILSPDQKVKAFDKEANGTIIGEGGAALILKSLKRAVQDGDYVHAVIKASCINSDGNRSSSLNSPSEEGQADAILKAIKKAEIDPMSISYLETHGTGTKIGDPIEISGITSALSQLGYHYQSVPIGSVKTNIGHLDTAAGIAGVVKVILALKHQQIPPSIHFKEPNPFIDFDHSPVFVNDRLSEWGCDTVRRAGVTSLGLTGTNAHMIVEEAPVLADASPEWMNVVTLSARTEKSLQKMVSRLHEYLLDHPELSITDIAYTLNTGRRKLSKNLVLAASTTEELIEKLTAEDYAFYTLDAEGTYFETVDGELVGKNARGQSFSPIFIYPDFDVTSLETLENIFTGDPFQRYLEDVLGQVQTQVTDLEKLNQPQVRYLLHLYAYTKLLEDYSIQHKAALGFGIGEIVADLILGDIKLYDAIKQVMKYDRPMEPIVEERLVRVIDSIIEAGFNSFVLVTPPVKLAEIFNQVLEGREEAIIYPFDPVREALSENLIQLLKNGVKIDWNQAYSQQVKKRLSLPGYIFDRKSYYLEMKHAQQSAATLVNEEQSEEMVKQVFDPEYVEERIRSFLQEFKPDKTINLEQNFEQLGMDSLALIHFIGKIKQEFGVNIPLTLFFKNMTVGTTLQEVHSLIMEDVQGECYISKYPDDIYLSVAPVQQFLYKMAQINPWAGHIARGWKVISKVNKAKLEYAFQSIVERHESLRTSFEIVDGKLLQKVHTDVEFKVNYIKANLFTAKKKVSQQLKSFDLSKPPLLRVTLVEAWPISYLFYEVPYIIVDATSLHLLMEEFFVLYNDGQLPELRIHQKDFALWQIKQLQKTEMCEKAEYWTQLFQDGIREINLPVDYSRPTVFDGTGKRQEYWIKRKLTEQLNHLALSQSVTMNMVLLAAFNILLAKYTGEEELTIGSLIGGRSHVELERLIGHFAFVLPLKNYPTGDKSFAQFVQEVKVHSLEAFENQEYPIELLMEEQKIQRGAERGPWFDVNYTYRNMTGNSSLSTDKSKIKMFLHDIDYWTVTEDLILILMETDRGLMVDLRYSTQLFKDRTIQRLKNDYVHVLKEIVANPEVRIDDIKMKRKMN